MAKLPLISETDYTTLLNENRHHLYHLKMIVTKGQENCEANYFYKRNFEPYPEGTNKQRNLASLARRSNNILEIGVNAGHTCFLMLLVNPRATITALDICNHKYVKPCVRYLNSHFNNRITLIEGNSAETLPKLKGLFDLFHIDGSHETNIANLDLINCRRLAHSNSYVVMDDTDMPTLKALWQNHLERRHILELKLLKANHSIGIFQTTVKPPPTINEEVCIALGMIVKDEERRIQVSLKSCKDHVDKFIILDTGSTDNTCQIIRNFCEEHQVPLSLYQTKFVDFSTTRNELLAYINQDTEVSHILLLDANDELQGGEHLREFLEFHSDLEGFFTVQRWRDMDTGAGLKFARFRTIRLIRNLDIWRYHGVVHEVFDDTGRKVGSLPDNIVLYQDRPADNDKSSARYKRDIELLTKEYEKDPNNGRTVFYLANSYYFSHLYDDAIKYYTIRVSNFPPNDEQYYMSLLRIGMCHSFLKRKWSIVFPWFWKAWEMLKNIEPIVYMARHYYDCGDMVTAYMLTKMACKLEKPEGNFHVDDSIYDYKRWYLASMIFHQYEEYEEGYQASKKALSCGYATAWDHNKLTHNYLLYEDMLIQQHFLADPNRPTILIFGGWSYGKWNGKSIYSPKGIGGSETATIYISQYLVKMGYHVVVCCDTATYETVNGVEYIKLTDYESYIKTYWIDTLIVLRFSEYIRYRFNIQQVFLWLEDVTFKGEGFYDDPKLRNIVTLCHWHQKFFTDILPESVKHKVVVCGNGVMPRKVNFNGKQPYRFIYSSCASRGLRYLVDWFPAIKRVIPEAELHIYSDFDNNYINDHSKFDYIPDLKIKIYETPGIFNHGRKPQSELFAEICRSGIWLYPTDFEETYCITALEMQLGRVLCIYTPIGSLPEVIGDRGLVIPNVEEEGKQALLKILGDLRSGVINREDYLNRAEVWARQQTWEERAKTWQNLIDSQKGTKTVNGSLLYQDIRLKITLLKEDKRLTFELLREGVWEKDVAEYLYRTLDSSYTFIDIGAHLGAHTLLASQKARRVYAFEADELFHTILGHNLSQNKITNVVTYQIALGDSQTRVKLGLTDNTIRHPADKSIKVTNADNGILCLTLDQIVDKLDVSQAIIKIDTSGYELLVLKGGEQLLRKYHPTLILEVSEVTSQMYGYSLDDLFSYLEGLEYTVVLMKSPNLNHYLCLPGEAWKTDQVVPLNPDDRPHHRVKYKLV